MELKEFISKTLVDITEGIAEASDSIGRSIGFATEKNSSSNIEFDVAVTVESGSSAEGGAKAGISIASIDLISGKLKGQIEEKSSNVSRVKFSVWIQRG